MMVLDMEGLISPLKKSKKLKILSKVSPYFISEVASKWREPLKLCYSSPLLHCGVPPEDDITNDDSNLKGEEEDALALTLVTDLVLRKRKTTEVNPSEQTEDNAEQGKKKMKGTVMGNFGAFSIGHNDFKAEEAGLNMPPPPK